MILFGMGGEIKRDIRPVLLIKFGVVIALSLGGVIYSILRAKRNKPKPPQSGGGKSSAKNNGHARTVSDKHEELRKVSSDSIIAAISPSIRYNGDNDKFLLPEFNELVKEFDLAATRAGFSPRKDVDSPRFNTIKSSDRDEYEREINNLKNLVRVLSERERTLEIQLLEYCGLKEQEAVVMELRNHLKLNNMEAKIFSLKIESLKADNKRLEAQLSDYAKVVTELEATKGKIKLLKKKLKFETEQNKEHLLALQQRVQLLQDKENQADVASEKDAIAKVQKAKNLEEELGELRNSNHRLRVENSELAQKLDYTRLLANSVLEDQEIESLRNESSVLRQKNEDLINQMEQLKADRCADVEELVYLRWINACLRYELRNYKPAPGKTIARDLSKTISPKSEDKAKRLIMEYANKEGLSEKDIANIDSDLEGWSSTCSNIADAVDFGSCPIDDSSCNKTNNNNNNKAKFLTKLKRLVTGKDNNHHPNRCHRRSSSMENLSIPSTPRGRFVSSSQASSRSSLDLGKLKSARSADTSDMRLSSVSRMTSSISSSSDENQLSENHESAKDSDLLKFAKVLKDSSKENSNSRPSSVSSHSF